MTEREKVIKGLECIANENGGLYSDCPYYTCPYYAANISANCFRAMAHDVLKLLKEQEPMKPDGENCGKCGYILHRINWDGPDRELRHEWFRFCPACGKAVKWDD